MKIGISRTAASTGGGTQVLPALTSGLGPCKAAIITATTSTTISAMSNDARFSQGIAVSSGAQIGWTATSFTGRNPSTVWKVGSGTHPIITINVDGVIVAKGRVTAFGDSSITIVWDQNPATPFFLNVVYFCGEDVEASIVLVDTTSGNQTFSIGHPTRLAFFSSHRGTLNEIPGSDNSISLGFCHNTGGIDPQSQVSTNLFDRANVSPTESAQMLESANIARGLTHALIRGAVELGNFTATGFDAIQKNGLGLLGAILALNFDSSQRVWVGLQSTPTATGLHEFTGPGFQPEFWAFLPTLLTAADTHTNTGSIASWGFDVTVANLHNRLSASCHSQDNVATSSAQSLQRHFSLTALNPAVPGGISLEAQSQAFTANGLQVNFTNVQPSPILLPTLAISKETLRKGKLFRPFGRGFSTSEMRQRKL